MKTRAKRTKSTQRIVLNFLIFKTIFKLQGKNWNAKENYAEQKNTNQTHFKCQNNFEC